MPFVKLDTGILHSTLWFERDAREVFITALLMAEPCEITAPVPQIHVDSMEYTGFLVPPGWYGFVRAAGIGIIRQAGMDRDIGLKALAELGSPDRESRSSDFEGRRLVRVDGGFIVLNYIKYRERDNTTADRSRRWRQRQKELTLQQGVTVSQRSDATPTDTRRHQAEGGEVEGEVEVKVKRGRGKPSPRYSQSDFDERDLRKIADARRKLDQRLGAQVGSNDGVTNGEYFGQIAEDTGIPVKRILELVESSRKWPSAS